MLGLQNAMTNKSGKRQSASAAAAAATAEAGAAGGGGNRRSRRARGGGSGASSAAPAAAAAADSQARAEPRRAQSERGAGRGSRVADTLLWTLATLLIAAAIGGNFYYLRYVATGEGVTERLLRVGAVIAVIAAGLAVTLLTSHGRSLLSFARDSYVELRKVIWPTRPEATQTTLIIFVAVCVVSLFLYLCDLAFLQLVRLITL